MDWLQTAEITHIQKLQHVFGDYSEIMLFLSQLGDPRSAFLVCVPLVYCVSRAKGLKVMWAAVMSEWLNLILKKLLHGQRPYWWIHFSNLFNDSNRPIIKQYRLTCETGPGVPSGHAMVTTAVWFIMMSSLATYLQSANQKSRTTKLLSLLPWLFLSGLASVVCVSRVFIASHFTHQVFLGVFVGLVVGLLVAKLPVETFATSTHLAFAFSTVLVTFIQNGLLIAMDSDPAWSIPLALRWCDHKEWVHLDTTPFYTLARDFGSLALMVVAERAVALKEIPSVLRKIVAAGMCLVFAQVAELVKFSVVDVNVFYLLGAVKYGLIMVGVVVIKRLWCCGVKDKKC
ncbi:glucose-6-phosphatase 3-like [Asterias rubens]|uniref:glucose-6-phosphatase 3-like n=1 Tax=Asterias rubens TaxID=7604 RepID=UPI0014554744|nr:glucose-6-phosphatase 3-like [Asterias rubens]